MRRRVIAVLLGFALVAVLGFAIPLALSIAANRTQELRLAREADGTHFAALAAQVTSGGSETADVALSSIRNEADRYHELYGEGILFVDARGLARVSVGLRADDPGIPDAILSGLRNQRRGVDGTLAPWSDDKVLTALPVGSGAQVDGAVVLQVSTGAARSEIASYWILTAVGTGVSLILITLLALGLSRWTVRPLESLTERVVELGSVAPRMADDEAEDKLSIHESRSGPPEVRTLAESFDTMSAAVRASARAQRQLVADTAHQLRNPLAALRIRLDTLSAFIPETAQEPYRRAGMEVERLSAALEGLLALATAEASQVSAGDEGSWSLLHPVVKDRVDAWADAMARAGIDLTDDVPEEISVRISDSHLGQMFDVLLSNAHNYVGRGGQVHISARIEGDGVRIICCDNGPGVAPEEIEELTGRFFRGSSASGPGTGLGLSIVRVLVENVGGTVQIENVDPHGLAVAMLVPSVHSTDGTR